MPTATKRRRKGSQESGVRSQKAPHIFGQPDLVETNGASAIARRYVCDSLHKGEVLEVFEGLGGGTFGTGRRTRSGGHHRVKAKDLPMRAFRGEAQADLDAYAARLGLREHTETRWRCKQCGLERVGDAPGPCECGACSWQLQPAAANGEAKAVSGQRSAVSKTKTRRDRRGVRSQKKGPKTQAPSPKTKGPSTALVPLRAPARSAVSDQQSAVSDPLTKQERKLFAQREKEITRDVKAIFRVGEALREIQQKRLYRAKYETFEEYVRERWGLGKSDAYRQIQAAEINEVVSPIGDKLKIRLTSESHFRPLAKLQDAEEYREVLGKVAKAVPLSPDGQRHVTAADIGRAVRQFVTPPEDLERGRQKSGVRSQKEPATSHQPPATPAGMFGQGPAVGELSAPIWKELRAAWDNHMARLTEVVRAIADGPLLPPPLLDQVRKVLAELPPYVWPEKAGRIEP